MSLVTVDREGEVHVVRMSRGATNAIDLDLVRALAEAIEGVRAHAQGLVLAASAEAKFFSIGLDLPHMLGQGRAELRTFWSEYNRLCLDLYTLPMPTACAMRGHAIAGGTILALMEDRRVIGEGRRLMGLNEVRIGLPVPLLPHLVLRDVVGERAATAVVSRGDLHDAEAALKLGLVDEVCPVEEVEPRAIAWVAELAALPREAFAAIKRNRTAAVSEAFRDAGEAKVEEFLDCWFTPETSALLSKAAEKF